MHGCTRVLLIPPKQCQETDHFSIQLGNLFNLEEPVSCPPDSRYKVIHKYFSRQIACMAVRSDRKSLPTSHNVLGCLPLLLCIYTVRPWQQGVNETIWQHAINF